MIHRIFAVVPVALVALLLAAPAARSAEPARQAELEKQFMDALTGATMTGSFTVTGGRGEGQPPKTESYFIESVTKIQDNLFMFKARMGKEGPALPMPLVVLWAGDTPVITLTDAAIAPGGKKYTARVVVYRDHYAGFWSSPDHGGHLFGTIARDKAGK